MTGEIQEYDQEYDQEHDPEKPIPIVHWFNEDNIMEEASGILWDREDDLSEKPEMQQAVRELLQEYEADNTWACTLIESIETELNRLADPIIQQTPPGELQKAVRELQAAGAAANDPNAITHHPTSETLLHHILWSQGDLREGCGWLNEKEAEELAPVLVKRIRDAVSRNEPAEHLLEEIDRETLYLAHRALDRMEDLMEDGDGNAGAPDA